MPHLDQSDRRIKAYRGDISALCAPTASANALIWLSKNGHSSIKYDNAYSLVSELAQRARTVDGGVGTSFQVLSDAMVKFIHEAGYDCSYRYMGTTWTGDNDGHFVFSPIDWDLLKKSLLNKNQVALIQIDLCHYSVKEKSYITTSGHLITLAGYDDEKRVLVVADPNEGHSLTNCSFKLVEQQEGIVMDNHLPLCNASGLYQIIRKESCTTDIITGAAIFTVN